MVFLGLSSKRNLQGEAFGGLRRGPWVCYPNPFVSSQECQFKRRTSLATHKSAEKRARQSERRNATNRKRRSQVRTAEQKIRALISSKDKKAAEAMLAAFMSAVQKAAKTGVIHSRAAARRIARVATQISALGK